MTKELETLLTELYVLIDDRVVEPRHGRGRRPVLSDAELLTLAVAQMLLGFDCERRWIRHAHGSQQLRALFPYIPGQSDYHTSDSKRREGCCVRQFSYWPRCHRRGSTICGSPTRRRCRVAHRGKP